MEEGLSEGEEDTECVSERKIPHVPLDIFGIFVSFYWEPKDFLTLYLLSKQHQWYFENENPDSTKHVVFRIKQFDVRENFHRFFNSIGEHYHYVTNLYASFSATRYRYRPHRSPQVNENEESYNDKLCEFINSAPSRFPNLRRLFIRKLDQGFVNLLSNSLLRKGLTKLTKLSLSCEKKSVLEKKNPFALFPNLKELSIGRVSFNVETFTDLPFLQRMKVLKLLETKFPKSTPSPPTPLLEELVVYTNPRYRTSRTEEVSEENLSPAVSSTEFIQNCPNLRNLQVYGEYPARLIVEGIEQELFLPNLRHLVIRLNVGHRSQAHTNYRTRKNQLESLEYRAGKLLGEEEFISKLLYDNNDSLKELSLQVFKKVPLSNVTKALASSTFQKLEKLSLSLDQPGKTIDGSFLKNMSNVKEFTLSFFKNFNFLHLQHIPQVKSISLNKLKKPEDLLSLTKENTGPLSFSKLVNLESLSFEIGNFCFIESKISLEKILGPPSSKLKKMKVRQYIFPTDTYFERLLKQLTIFNFFETGRSSTKITIQFVTSILRMLSHEKREEIFVSVLLQLSRTYNSPTFSIDRSKPEKREIEVRFGGRTFRSLKEEFYSLMSVLSSIRFRELEIKNFPEVFSISLGKFDGLKKLVLDDSDVRIKEFPDSLEQVVVKEEKRECDEETIQVLKSLKSVKVVLHKLNNQKE